MIEKNDVTVLYPPAFNITGFEGVVFDSKLKELFASPRVDALLVDELKKRIIGHRSRTNLEAEQFDRIRFFHTQRYADLGDAFYIYFGALVAEYLDVRIIIHGIECAQTPSEPTINHHRPTLDALSASTLRLENSLPSTQKPH